MKFAIRQLFKNPGFTAVALLTLALGIGANTAIFQLLDAVRLKSLPVKDPQELVEVRFAGGNPGIGISDGANSEMSYPLWEHFQKQGDVLSGIFAWGRSELPIGDGVETRMVKSLFTSGDFFSVLGVSPVQGRLFNGGDDRRGAGPGGVVISYAYWQSQFGGAPTVVGRTITIGDRIFEIIGVTPVNFHGLEVGQDFDVALPLSTRAMWVDNILDRTDAWWLRIMGRLKPGSNVDQITQFVNTIGPGILEAAPLTGYGSDAAERYKKLRFAASCAATGVSQLRVEYNKSLWLLLGITGLVLAIACLNVANLSLARGSARAREMAVRLALGGSRARLIRELTTESVLLAGLGALAGIGLAQLLSRAILWFLSTQGNLLNIALDLDWRVLSFTSLAAMGACVVFGVLPAIRSTQLHPAAALSGRGSGQGATRARFAFQRLLMVCQMAVSLVLLVGAFLLVRSFCNLVNVHPGFRQDGIFVVWANFSRQPPGKQQLLKEELLQRIRSIPQVQSAAETSHVPLYGSSWTMSVRVTGSKEPREGSSKVTFVSPDYFKTLEIPFIVGRDFNERDRKTSPKVALVNETFVRRFLGNANPVGATVRTAAEPNYPEAVYEVVGLVKDSKYGDLRQEIPPIMFAPASQHPVSGAYASMVVRFSGQVSAITAAVKQQVAELEPTIHLGTGLLRKDVLDGLSRERLMAWLSGLFGALALVLVMVGLYGLISYITLVRRNELGIRLALGGQRSHILGLVLRQGFQMASFGVVLGLGVALALGQLMRGLLFDIASWDLASLLEASVLLMAIAIVACWLPARRAMKLEPMEALRYE